MLNDAGLSERKTISDQQKLKQNDENKKTSNQLELHVDVLHCVGILLRKKALRDSIPHPYESITGTPFWAPKIFTIKSCIVIYYSQYKYSHNWVPNYPSRFLIFCSDEESNPDFDLLAFYSLQNRIKQVKYLLELCSVCTWSLFFSVTSVYLGVWWI